MRRARAPSLYTTEFVAQARIFSHRYIQQRVFFEKLSLIDDHKSLPQCYLFKTVESSSKCYGNPIYRDVSAKQAFKRGSK